MARPGTWHLRSRSVGKSTARSFAPSPHAARALNGDWQYGTCLLALTCALYPVPCAPCANVVRYAYWQV